MALHYLAVFTFLDNFIIVRGIYISTKKRTKTTIRMSNMYMSSYPKKQ